MDTALDAFPRTTAERDGMDADWVKTGMGLAAAIVGVAASIVAWIWNDRAKGHDKEVERIKSDAADKLRLADDRLVAERAAAVLEVVRVREAADAKARERVELDRNFAAVNTTLQAISGSIHALGEDLGGKIGDLRHAVEAIDVRVETLERAVAADHAVIEKKRAQLNGLIQALQVKGIVTSFDPDQSTGVVAQGRQMPEPPPLPKRR